MELDSPEQRDVHARVERDYLPAWCAAQALPVEVTAFAPDWSFLTPGLARWFAAAIDEKVVEIVDGWPTLPDQRRTYLFEKPGGRPKLYREGFIEVAAAGVLALQHGWPAERLSFQSPKRGRAAVWAFDLLAYADDARSRVAIAGEAKWRQRDAVALVEALSECGRRGEHSAAACIQKPSDHRKFVGLLEFRPEILWIIGPDAFTDEPDLVFIPSVTPDDRVHLTRTTSNRLAAR